MNQVFYLEADEDVTGVINKIRKSEKAGLVFVVPRGGTIGQSLINLKLLKRSAIEHGKVVALVAADTITKNLAKQLELPVFAKVGDAEKHDFSKEIEEAESRTAVSGLKVKHYRKYDLSKRDEIEPLGSETPKEDFEETVSDEKTEEEAADDSLEITEEADPRIRQDEADVLSKTENQPKFKHTKIKEEPAAVENDNNEEDDSIDISSGLDAEEAFGEADDLLEEEDVDEKKSDKPEEINKRPAKNGRVKYRLILIIFVLCLLAGGVFAYISLPKAQISIVAETTDKEKEIEAEALATATGRDLATMTLPGQYISFENEQSKTFDSSGRKDVGTPATGKVTIQNTVSTTSQVVSTGTKLTASDGKIFILQKGVIVPGATLKNCQMVSGTIKCDTDPGTAEATVFAEANGEAYNIGPSKFTVGKLSAENKEAFTGGVAKIVRYVTNEDIEKAAKSLQEEMSKDMTSSFETKIGESNLFVCDNCRGSETVLAGPDKAVNTEADTFEYKLKLKLFALGLAESELKTLAVESLGTDLASDQAVVDPDNAKVSFEVSGVSLNDGSLKVKAKIVAKIGRKIDLAKIKQDLANKSLQSAKIYLEGQNGVKAASISLWPALLKRTPVKADNIEIKYDYEK